ncbi:FUSC family protein [Jatrophihabitans fulvus]
MTTTDGSRATLARTSVGGLLRQALKLDRTQSDPVVAFRNAVGIAAPLAIGAVAGHAGFGLAATVGALQTGFADRPGPYRLRMLRMLGVATAAATTSTLAVLCSRTAWLAVVLLFVLALGAGLLLSAGPSATQFGIATTASALVLGHLPEPPGAAVHIGLLVLAGGAGQTLLAVAAWPLGRHRPERDALAALYRDIAHAARAQPGTVVGPPAGDSLAAARAVLYGLGHDHGPSVEAYRVLLDEADRIRRELIALVASAERLAGQGNPILAGLTRGAIATAAGVLDELADALTAGRSVDEQVLSRARAGIASTQSRLVDSADAPGVPTRRATAARLRALGGQLRAVVESTGTGAIEGRRDHTVDLRDPLDVVRANLTPDSAVLRHAVRLAVVVAGGDAVVRLLGIDRGYWVALTLLVVLRPDFGATLQRGVMRTAGTVVGLLVATALVHFVPGGDWWHVALIGVAAFGMRLAGPGNVGLTAISLSALVVVLLQVQGVPAQDTVVARAVATLAGGAIAVLAVLVLPAWERQYLPARCAALLRAYRDYVDAVLAADADGSDADRARLQAARHAARLARTNAQASLDRAVAEPVPAPRTVELGRTVLANSHRLVHAVLEIDTVRRPLREAGAMPLLEGFVAAVGSGLDTLADGVERGRPVALRRLRAVRDEALAAVADRVDTETLAVLDESTDRVTNALDTLAAELRRQRADGDTAPVTVEG